MLKKVRTRGGKVKYVHAHSPVIHPANFRKFEFLKRYGILPRKGVITIWRKAKIKGGRIKNYKDTLFNRIGKAYKGFGYFSPIGFNPKRVDRRRKRNVIAKASRRRNR